MQVYKFTSLIWAFNALIDSGDYADVSIEDVKSHAGSGTVSKFLLNRFPNADFSPLNAKDWTDLDEEWQGFDGGIDEGRKMGVRKSGLCLLLGYALQSLQNRQGEKDRQFEARDA